MIPRNEHPNPNFKRENYEILNGEWEFEFDFGNSGVNREMFKNSSVFSKKITVPFCVESELSGIGYKDFIPAVWYRKKINVPAKILIIYARKLAFPAERNYYLLGKYSIGLIKASVMTATCTVSHILPLTVKIYPIRTNKLRSGILRTRYINAH